MSKRKCEKIKERKKWWKIPDLPSWWGLRGENRAWCWVGGTGSGRPQSVTPVRASAWSCHCRRRVLEFCGGSQGESFRRDESRWSRRRRSCILSSALSASRPDPISRLRLPFPFPEVKLNLRFCFVSFHANWKCAVFGEVDTNVHRVCRVERERDRQREQRETSVWIGDKEMGEVYI